MTIKTAGELRAFLADVLVGIRNGSIDVEEANAIAKVSGQINQSLAVEAKTAIELQKMGGGGHIAGSMQIASGEVASLAGPKWCEQCEAQVTPEDAAECRQKFCKAKAA